MAESILAAFLAHAKHTPQQPCISYAGQEWSYGTLREHAAHWASRLAAADVASGDRVGLFLGSSPDFVAAYLGIHWCGGAAVLINTQYRQVELSHILSDSGTRLVIVDAQSEPHLQELLAINSELSHIRWLSAPSVDHPASEPSKLPHDTPDGNDLALLAYTSGTTGRSKGAMLLHRNLAANSAAVTQAWRWTAADRLLLTLPLFHIHGLGVGINGSLLVGGSIDLRPRFEAHEVLETLRSGACTMFFGVPTMYTRLIDEVRGERGPGGQGVSMAAPYGNDHPFTVSPTHRLTSPRLYVSGSAPLSPQTFAEFATLFGQPILERYGMSETIMNMTNPYEGERRPGTVGQPFPGQQGRIVDVRSRQPLPDGEIGEIQVRGPHVFAGYWNRPEASAEAFDDEGWFNTGDLGWRSADGYYTITGRAKELIISGGYNIYPREVEEVLLAHPAVAEAAVLGLPDAEFGEQVAAVVVLREGQQASPEELVEHCKSQLAAYKKPRRVVFVTSLPRNALGKVVKPTLREIVMSDE
jgi:malonyl-CoA/methylmalonyl-CoA synthetase